MKKILTVAMLMGISPISKAQTNSDPFQQARKAIEANNAIYADLANKNDGSILTRYTEDACLLPANAAPICGKENIAKFFKDGPKVHVKFTIQHLYGDASTFITEESYYEMTDLNGNKLDEGKVIVIWKNTAEGLKMHRDMFSSNKPVSK
ncbi:hypothetical protein [Chitinophaga sp. CF418]|uniref:YybH family protein n=1 Tax=Chitinophaga sp. CF418 TaxID=1855287 RepID=UPI000910C169|nr:hypothetical protein [Chitinophaga sp. CF418]SHN24806.1 Ketosteroid isomerase homolog [Chitinophaga sp. CF418]